MFQPRSVDQERALLRTMLAERDSLEDEHRDLLRRNVDSSLNAAVSANFKARAALMWNLGLQCFVVACRLADELPPARKDEADSLFTELLFRSQIRAIELLYCRLAAEGAAWLQTAWRRRGFALADANPLPARFRLNELEGEATEAWQLRIHRQILGPNALP